MNSLDDQAKCLNMGGYVLRFEDDPDPGEFFLEIARRELRETEERKQQALEDLKQLLKGEKDLIAPLDIEPYLIAFLRATKFYPESAFQKICNMYRFRYNNPKYGANLIPSQDRNVFCHSILSALPYRDQHGRRILIAEVGKKWNVREVSLTEIARGVMLIVDAAIMEPKTQISGAIVIIDFEGLSIQHVWQFSPSVAKIILEWVQECLPCRLKAVHIINQPYLFNMLFAIFKPFIDEKLRNRIFFHGSNTSSLLQHVDAKSIPMKYGGDMKIDTDHGPELHKLLCQYSELYEKGSQCGYQWNKK